MRLATMAFLNLIAWRQSAVCRIWLHPMGGRLPPPNKSAAYGEPSEDQWKPREDLSPIALETPHRCYAELCMGGVLFDGANRHQPKKSPSTSVGARGDEGWWGGPSWSPASCSPGSQLGGTRSPPHHGPP